MKKILNRLSLVIGISLLLLVNVHAQDVCNRPDPNIYENGGVSFFSECRNGMGFPVFNVYNDWPIYPGFNDEEFNFLRTRIESPEAESQPRWGFRDNVRISNDGQITRLKMRVHNGGNANLNNRGDVIARDVRLKVNGFTRAEDGSWIHEPDRIDPTTNTAFHIISATLSASNTTPNTLEDTVTIRTNADKVLKLYQNRRDTDFGLGIIKMCTSRFELNEETGDYICIDANGDGDQDYEPNKFTASNIVSGRGLNLQSVPQGVSGNLFYASEGYKQNISVFVVTTDAPEDEEEFECRSLNIADEPLQIDEAHRTALLQLEFESDNFDEQIFDIRQSNLADDGARVFRDREGLTLQVVDWTEDTVIETRVRGEEDNEACQDTFDFEEFGDDDGQCEITRLFTETIGDNFRLTAITRPPSFQDGPFIWEVTGAEVVEEEGNTLTITNFDEETLVTVEHVDDPDCNGRFDDFQPPDDEDELCRNLEMNRETYNFDETPRPQFDINLDSLNPSGFDGPFNWQVINENDNVTELVSKTRPNTSFRPSSPLDGTQTVRVSVPSGNVEPGFTCEDEADSEKPPLRDRCDELTIARPSGELKLPTSGEPIRLQLVVEPREFEGEVTWSSNPPLAIFNDGNNNEALGSMTTDINSPMVVRNGSPEINQNVTVFVEVPGAGIDENISKLCARQFGSDDVPGDTPEITKEVLGSRFVSDGRDVTYRVTYDPGGFYDETFDTVTIYDIIGTEGVFGFNTEVDDQLGTLEPLPQSTSVSDNVPRDQISGSILTPDGVTITNVDDIIGEITIEYSVRVNSAITDDFCRILIADCGISFTNYAYDNFGVESNDVTLLSICPFVLARGFGDIFLEEELGGVDVARCSARPSAQGPVFTPLPPLPPSTPSTGGALLEAGHRICQEGYVDRSTGEALFGGDIREQLNFSSAVCEVALNLADRWSSTSIQESIKVNVLRIARNLQTLNTTEAPVKLSNLTDTSLNAGANPNPGRNVFITDGADLVIGNGGTVDVDGRAKTFIVRNGDLKINSNIKYATSETDPSNPTVVAFMVINGNIEIGPNVTEIDGIYAAVKDDEGTGFITRTETSSKTITIQGSVFGDIQPLFRSTTAVGDITLDRGAVTVLYDGRIIQNTPPGLEDVVEFNQFQTATGSSIYDQE